jgi:hypothetical protein
MNFHSVSNPVFSFFLFFPNHDNQGRSYSYVEIQTFGILPDWYPLLSQQQGGTQAVELENTTDVKFSSIQDFQVKVRRENNMDVDAEGNEEGPEITLPREEYEALTRQVHEADELANKRVVAALAKVGPSLLITSEAQNQLKVVV